MLALTSSDSGLVEVEQNVMYTEACETYAAPKRFIRIVGGGAAKLLENEAYVAYMSVCDNGLVPSKDIDSLFQGDVRHSSDMKSRRLKGRKKTK